MYYTLPTLEYTYDALEPYIDEQTMKIHHTKHHQTYVDNLNTLIAKFPGMKQQTSEDILKNLHLTPVELRKDIQKNIGGDYNHRLFWQSLTPNKSEASCNIIFDRIEKNFGSFENFKTEFTKASLSIMGGWAWLTSDSNAQLHIAVTENQDNPLSKGLYPLLGLDVWEHSYYLKYQNRRKDYIENWWHIINWDFVASRLHTILK